MAGAPSWVVAPGDWLAQLPAVEPPAVRTSVVDRLPSAGRGI